MTDFLPILNFDFGETPVLSVQDEYFFYEKALDVLNKTFNEIEISFVSDAFVFNAPEILKHAAKLDLRIAFGSIYEPEQVGELIRLLKKSDFIQAEVKIFSPVYQKEIHQILTESKEYNFKYIPGFFTREDLKLAKDFINDCDMLKIFPFNVNTPKELYSKLYKPYPELRKHLYVPKILFASQELIDKYQILDNVQVDEKGSEYVIARNKDQVYIIRSPLDYQKIRSRFLFSSTVKILFDFKEKISEEDVSALTQDKRVFLTGIRQKNISDELLRNRSIVVGSNVFTNTLKDHLSGTVKTEDLGPCMEEELGVIRA